MKLTQSISPEQLREFELACENDPISRIAGRAVSKTGVNDICYDTRQARKMNYKFSVDIETLPAANQKASGRCWIFAGLNILREKIAKALNLEDFELSQNYLSFYDHLEKANTFLEHVIDTAAAPLEDRYVSMLLSAPVGDGGWWEYFVGLCNKYGVCPKEAMPETHQSSNTDNLNMLLNMQLRKDARQLRQALAAGTPVEQVREKKQAILCRVYNLLTIFLGTPPKTFDFEYVDKDRVYHADRDLTARTFYDRYIGTDLDQIVSILNAPMDSVPYYRTYYTAGEESIFGTYQAKRLNLPMEEFKAAVVRQLQAGELVWFVCDCDYYGSMAEGIWDTGLYDYETPFGLDLQMEKGDLLEYRQCSLNHAMVLTGVNLVDGRPDKWKIQNSWGTEKGNKGYFIMSDAWFDRYVYTASIAMKHLTEQQQAQFRQEPTVMPPWNVLG